MDRWDHRGANDAEIDLSSPCDHHACTCHKPGHLALDTKADEIAELEREVYEDAEIGTGTHLDRSKPADSFY
jgi:hypothetical protein